MKITNTDAVYISSIFIIVLVFIIDLLTPLGYVVWLGYYLSIFLSSRTLPQKHIFTMAALITLLIVLGFIHSPSNISPGIAISNRTTGIVILWLMTILLVQRRRAEDRIREQADLLDKANDGIIALDMAYKIIFWNRGAEYLYGYRKAEMMGENIELIFSSRRSDHFGRIKKGLAEKGEWRGELCQVKKNGDELLVESSWNIVRNDKGGNRSIFIINTDITEKKKIETQILRAQKIENISLLAAGIAHDINNVLSPIMLSVEILEEKFPDEDSRKLVGIIKRSAKRGSNLINQIHFFARGQAGERSPIQVSHLILELEQVLIEIFPQNIRITIETQEDLWTVTADPTQLNQVLMNLCMNARDAMPAGGLLNISAENLFIDDPEKVNIDAKPGPYIIISVSDTGTGIPAGMLEKIFDPFFTTKGPGKGTGLGLSIAFIITKSHGGFIDVHSEIGRGTTFRVHLPAIGTAMTVKSNIGITS